MPSSSDSRSSILLIAYFYPPSREVAAHRAAAFAKYLARRGHEVTVLTTAAFGTDPGDRAANPCVERAYDLQLAAARLRGAQAASDALSRSEYTGPTLVGRLAVPDGYLIAWAPFAWRAAKRLLRSRDFDCVVTTSPPESAHLIGRHAKRLGAAWIADLRDGWRFEALVKQRNWPFGFQHRIDRWLERRTLPSADLITAVTRPLVADTRRRFGGAELVSNGFDPEETAPGRNAPTADAHDGDLDSERFSLLYTGRLGGANRDPRPLITAVAELASGEPLVAQRLELVFAGAFTAEEVALFETNVTPARIVNLGLIERERTLALQQAANALLLMASPELTYQVPAKFYEYLFTGRPILALVSAESAAASIIAETSAGLVASPIDVDAIRIGLRRLVSDEFSGADAAARERYSYPAIVERLGDLVDRTVAGGDYGNRHEGLASSGLTDLGQRAAQVQLKPTDAS